MTKKNSFASRYFNTFSRNELKFNETVLYSMQVQSYWKCQKIYFSCNIFENTALKGLVKYAKKVPKKYFFFWRSQT